MYVNQTASMTLLTKDFPINHIGESIIMSFVLRGIHMKCTKSVLLFMEECKFRTTRIIGSLSYNKVTIFSVDAV